VNQIVCIFQNDVYALRPESPDRDISYDSNCTHNLSLSPPTPFFSLGVPMCDCMCLCVCVFVCVCVCLCVCVCGVCVIVRAFVRLCAQADGLIRFVDTHVYKCVGLFFLF